jgi:hypothetical protein
VRAISDVRAPQRILALAAGVGDLAWHTDRVFRRQKQREAQPAAPQPLDDSQVAKSMADLADAFVRGAAEEGHHFDFAPENASRLDALVDMFLDSQPRDDVVHSMVMSMGAYVGELIVRNAAGIWTYEPQTSAPGIKLRTGLLCFPLNKVGKRITVGPEHSIAQFVEVAMSGELRPTARRVDPPAPHS